MRPYVNTANAGLQPDTLCNLYVYRDWCSNGAWRLAWARPMADTYCNAEGECSAKLFRTMREAIAHGVRAYGETARKWRGHGYEFA